MSNCEVYLLCILGGAAFGVILGLYLGFIGGINFRDKYPAYRFKEPQR